LPRTQRKTRKEKGKEKNTWHSGHLFQLNPEVDCSSSLFFYVSLGIRILTKLVQIILFFQQKDYTQYKGKYLEQEIYNYLVFKFTGYMI
jgi:hypothetical protein